MRMIFVRQVWRKIGLCAAVTAAPRASIVGSISPAELCLSATRERGAAAARNNVFQHSSLSRRKSSDKCVCVAVIYLSFIAVIVPWYKYKSSDGVPSKFYVCVVVYYTTCWRSTSLVT